MPVRHSQVPKRLQSRRDLLALLAGAAELTVCPGCPDHGTWVHLAGAADALYAPDGATVVARIETNRWAACRAQNTDAALCTRSPQSKCSKQAA